jgi:hypothetical protein
MVIGLPGNGLFSSRNGRDARLQLAAAAEKMG